MLLMHARTEAREWRAEIALDAALGKQLILLRGARLPDSGLAGTSLSSSDSGGQVVICDDEGDVARTQRDSAWSEVARRLAHEIKNPLTPIQLAAERLRRKYLTTLPEADRDVLDRATHTIVAQVESLKTMVNAFSDYFLPETAIALKQGAGRLIRRETDQGVLVVCDSRLISMGYGKRLLRALPLMKRLNSSEEMLAELTKIGTKGG